MNITQLFRPAKKKFFSEAEEERMVQAIRSAEKQTSGEIRLFVESHCSFINAMDRAIELFGALDMQKTRERNGVLLYFAMKDRQLAILGDEGIHQKLGQTFWNSEVARILARFKQQEFTEGICGMITDVGEALREHFPYERDDNNELSDEIIFGK